MKHSIALTMPGLAIVLAQVGGVNAQESSLALEEVIVTATKREQNLQDVSVAVTALSEDVLREAQIVSSEDLTQLVPSLKLAERVQCSPDLVQHQRYRNTII